MLVEKELKKLANEAYSEFSKKYRVGCEFSFVSLDEFWKLAKRSKLVQDDIRRKIPLKIGALVVHGKKDKICLNVEVLNQITDNPNFVKAIVLHELSHVYLKGKVMRDSLNEDIKSENRVESFVQEEFPKYSKYLV
jgi:hypothetical protein